MSPFYVITLACLTAILCAATSRAADAELRYQNAATVPLTALRVTQDALPPTVIAVQCAAKATCKVIVPLAHGVHSTSIEAQATGTPWSLPSNVLPYRARDLALCDQSDVCAMDRNHDGVLTGTDFDRFIRAFGQSW